MTVKNTRSRAAQPLAVAATALVATVALYMALVAFGNITDFGTNQQFVRHVLAMDTTFKDEDLMWRSIDSATVQDIAYIAIIGWETVAALVLTVAAFQWVTALRGGGFGRAKRLATHGLVMVLLLFGAGFIAIGGEWFAMWQSADWNGLEAATRNFLVAGLVLVVVHLAAVEGRRDPGEERHGEGEKRAVTEGSTR
ncbi:hypothetical protein BGM19_32970 [Streptomyces agglomeratus]|uniref:DUF2165 domain-containing protein n=1 Tax=Streptomyces agglomeratus TaxID=285458 RepID=UPI00086C6A28|nr:DUF2165 domain-containing protein [Streptomyces agglomeratus]OEJ62128.1 hypothetical protein BGM19_32970 [Streptomyces agglomeratus]